MITPANDAMAVEVPLFVEQASTALTDANRRAHDRTNSFMFLGMVVSFIAFVIAYSNK